VLGAGSLCDCIAWWENTNGAGTAWEKHIVDGAYDGAINVYSTDIDGDGDADVLGAGSHCDEITWWENVNGTGMIWEEHVIDEDFDFGVSVNSADIDGDGDTDVLGAGFYCSDITWWENTDGAATVWSEHTIDKYFDHACSVCGSDIDGDGDADVLGAAGYADEITWWENIDGNGTAWEEHVVDGEYDGARSVFCTDLDGDGDADILAAGWYCKEITWWENSDGTGETWAEHTVGGDFDGAISVISSDLDGDDNMDVLGAAFIDNDITWWKVLRYSSEGYLESSILDAGTVGEWLIFLSHSLEPEETSVSFQFRSSQNFSDMGEWSDTVFTPDTPLAGILADSTRYLQYRVILETSSPDVSPELTDVAFSYSIQVSVGDGRPCEVDMWSLDSSENPSRGGYTALLMVPSTTSVVLSLFDVSGRVVAQTSMDLTAGTHSVVFPGLEQGVYFCTVHADGFSAAERFIFLD